MKIETDTLLSELKEKTRSHLDFAKKLQLLSTEKLNERVTDTSWSILECYAHLNLYGDFYLPEIEKQLHSSQEAATAIFHSGVLGNYFAKSMLPKTKPNKMKTFRSMNPIYSQLDKETLSRFIAQEEKMIELLEKAKSVNLTKTKTAISISNWLKLRLGDTFRFVIYHIERHQIQASRILNNETND